VLKSADDLNVEIVGERGNGTWKMGERRNKVGECGKVPHSTT